jgi:polyisoprenoid-binding protein YceI
MSVDRPLACAARLLLAALLSLASVPLLATEYVQASGSALAFAGKYQGETFSGRFPGFTTRLRFDPAQLDRARLEVTIPVARATTGVGDYDVEMRGSGFFDSARFPQARYVATTFRSLGGDRFAADGVLSLRGTSKPVTLEFTWTPGAQPVLRGRASVSRLAFGIGAGEWSDTRLLPDPIAVSTRVVLQPAP